MIVISTFFREIDFTSKKVNLRFFRQIKKLQQTLTNSIKIQSISRKNTQNIPIFGLKIRQIGNLLGTRIVRVFGQKYSRFE